ncbi:MAG: HAD-IC family P-type ATPase [Candidatus Limnocylindrales bacterium]
MPSRSSSSSSPSPRVEVFNELRAKRAVAALSSLGAPAATVIRDGIPAKVPASDLVAGDLIVLGPGDRVPADIRLLDSAALRVDESSLTGESVPVAKDAAALLSGDTELGDRATMVHAGTLITAGKAKGVVVATGQATELGRIAGLTEEARELPTPLQRAMRQLSGWLVWAALGISVVVPLLGVLLAGLAVEDMLLTGLTLAFATIPEELPILITIVLGIGSFKLARRGAIVKRLQAAETLGSVSVVATDKTGTLTENRMRVAEVFVEGEPVAPAAALRTPDRPPAVRDGRPRQRRPDDAGRTATSNSSAIRPRPRCSRRLKPAASGSTTSAPGTGSSRSTRSTTIASGCRSSPRDLTGRDGRRVLAVKGAPESVLAECVALLTAGRTTAIRPVATRSRREPMRWRLVACGSWRWPSGRSDPTSRPTGRRPRPRPGSPSSASSDSRIPRDRRRPRPWPACRRPASGSSC